MRIIAAILSVFFLVSLAHGAPAPKFTGTKYLSLSDSDRSIAVKTYINIAKKKNIIIRKSPDYYIAKLDAAFSRHANLKNEDFNKVLKLLIIMEYDWDQKGIDKDALARKYLSDADYKANKQRLGIK